MQQWIEKIKSMIRDNPKKLLIPLCFIGVLLAVAPSVFKGGGESKNTVSVNDDAECEQYVKNIEERLKNIVFQITGDKQAEVMVTIENGVEYIYASETKLNSDLSEDKSGEDSLKTKQSDKAEESYIVITNKDGEEQPLVITKVMPDIKGVIIVTQGGESELVAERLRSAAVTALGVSKSNVYITGRTAD